MFYERHATCRHFPFPFLLEVLSHKYRSANGLYELAMKGALEDYPRSRQWCRATVAAVSIGSRTNRRASMYFPRLCRLAGSLLQTGDCTHN
jgi:hypothetical protein